MKKPASQKGVAVVEFALLALLLLVFVFGIIEFGLIWLQSHYAANAAREGSRAASKIAQVTDGTLDNTEAVKSEVEEAIKSYLEGAFIYTEQTVKDCCDEDNFIYVHPLELETIGSTSNYALRVTVTLETSKIWEPVLWPLLNLIPGPGVGNIRFLTEEAVFPIISQ